MSLYRVEKREEPVVIYMSDGMVVEGVIFLSDFSHLHSGKQTALEMLREEEPFFPLRDQHGTFKLIKKSLITHVQQHEGAEVPEHYGKEVEVTLTFIAGESLRGKVLLNMPEGKNRIQDFINSSPGFFSLNVSGRPYIANGSLVRELIPQP